MGGGGGGTPLTVLSAAYVDPTDVDVTFNQAPDLTTGGEETAVCCRSAVVHLTTGPLDHSTTLAIYDACGRVVSSQPVRASSFILSTSSFPPGVYLARCVSRNRSSSARFTVQHR